VICPSIAKRARRRKKDAVSPLAWNLGCRYPVSLTELDGAAPCAPRGDATIAVSSKHTPTSVDRDTIAIRLQGGERTGPIAPTHGLPGAADRPDAVHGFQEAEISRTHEEHTVPVEPDFLAWSETRANRWFRSG
jgi:hypothetical protein